MTDVARLLNRPGNSDKLTHREPWCIWSEVQAEPLHGPQLNLEQGFDLINTGERPSNCLGEGKKIWVEEMGALQWDYKYKAPLGHMWRDTEKILGYSRSMRILSPIKRLKPELDIVKTPKIECMDWQILTFPRYLNQSPDFVSWWGTSQLNRGRSLTTEHLPAPESVVYIQYGWQR